MWRTSPLPVSQAFHGGEGEGTDRDSRVQTSDRQTVTLRQTDTVTKTKRQ